MPVFLFYIINIENNIFTPVRYFHHFTSEKLVESQVNGKFVMDDDDSGFLVFSIWYSRILDNTYCCSFRCFSSISYGCNLSFRRKQRTMNIMEKNRINPEILNAQAYIVDLCSRHFCKLSKIQYFTFGSINCGKFIGLVWDMFRFVFIIID